MRRGHGFAPTPPRLHRACPTQGSKLASRIGGKCRRLVCGPTGWSPGGLAAASRQYSACARSDYSREFPSHQRRGCDRDRRLRVHSGRRRNGTGRRLPSPLRPRPKPIARRNPNLSRRATVPSPPPDHVGEVRSSSFTAAMRPSARASAATVLRCGIAGGASNRRCSALLGA